MLLTSWSQRREAEGSRGCAAGRDEGPDGANPVCCLAILSAHRYLTTLLGVVSDALGPDVKLQVLNDGSSCFTFANRDSSDEDEESPVARLLSTISGPLLEGEDGHEESRFEVIV